MRSFLLASLVLMSALAPHVQAEDPDAGQAAPCRPWKITLGPDPTDIDIVLDPDHCIRGAPARLLEESPYCVHGSEPGCRGLEHLDQDVYDTAWTLLAEYGCILGSEPWC